MKAVAVNGQICENSFWNNKVMQKRVFFYLTQTNKILKIMHKIWIRQIVSNKNVPRSRGSQNETARFLLIYFGILTEPTFKEIPNEFTIIRAGNTFALVYAFHYCSFCFRIRFKYFHSFFDNFFDYLCYYFSILDLEFGRFDRNRNL